jgi:GTPase SAR1 family protein
MVTRLIDDPFPNESLPTIGVEFRASVRSGIRLQLWDASGMERFRSVTRVHSRSSQGAMFMFAVTNQASFEAIETWWKAVKDLAGSPHMILAGTQPKYSMASQRRYIKG